MTLFGCGMGGDVDHFFHPGTNNWVPVMLGHVISALMPPVVTSKQVSTDDEEGGGAAH
jgi:hypothetical protein